MTGCVSLQAVRAGNDDEMTLDALFENLGILDYAEAFHREKIDMESLVGDPSAARPPSEYYCCSLYLVTSLCCYKIQRFKDLEMFINHYEFV